MVLRFKMKIDNLEGIVSAWYQEIQDIAFNAEPRGSNVKVKTKLPRKHVLESWQSFERRYRLSENKEHSLNATLEVPDAAALIEIISLSIRTKAISASMIS